MRPGVYKTREKESAREVRPWMQNRLQGESFESTRPQIKRTGVFKSRELPPRSMDRTSPSSSARCAAGPVASRCRVTLREQYTPARFRSAPKDSVYHETSFPRKDDDAACGQLLCTAPTDHD